MNVNELLTPAVVRGLIAGAVLILAVMVLRRLFRGQGAVDAHHLKVTCNACGWTGAVSRYKPRCPRCNEALG